tara:strand:- start:139 stop:282 length:144 start_codon:yes stop_codon:yes gene_type:complete
LFAQKVLEVVVLGLLMALQTLLAAVLVETQYSILSTPRVVLAAHTAQ